MLDRVKTSLRHRVRRALDENAARRRAEMLDSGLRIGRNVSIQQGVSFDASHHWHIEIGDDVTLAPEVYLLAHDASTKRALGYTRIGKITIGDRTFVGARAIIMPGVSVGSDCVIGAGSVVTSSIPDGSVAAGNPARVICPTAEFLERRRAEMTKVPVFEAEYTWANRPGAALRDEMNDRMTDRIGYIV